LAESKAVSNMALHDSDVLPELRRLEGDYEFIRELGRGAMTAVYLARRNSDGLLVAIKFVRDWHRRDPVVTERFAREARMAARLDHPNIVRTVAVEAVDEEALAIVMQYVEGGTLRDALRTAGAFDAARAEQVLRDVADALSYAHSHGVVHRDVKPENIFLDRTTGRALLSDFGIARSLEGDTALTATGSALGTPTYMSPEQIDGLPADGRSDIYSLGLVGWELLAGRKPWAGENLYSVIYKQKREHLPRLTTLRDDIPTPLLYAVEGALQKDRETRWAHVDEFLAQLDERPMAPWVPAPTLAEAPPATTAPAPVVAAAAAAAAPRAGAPVSRRVPLRPRRHIPRAVKIGVPVALALAAAVAVFGSMQDRSEEANARFLDSLRVNSSAGEISRSPDTTRTRSGAAARPAPTPNAGRRATTPVPAATTRRDSAATRPAPAATPAATPARTPARTPAPSRTATPTPPATRATTTPAPRPATGALRSHADSLARCSSAADRDQRICLAAALADADQVLNRTYAALIADLRRRDGAGEPASVRRLREQQREWMVRRDAACLREARPSPDGRWALPRVNCLGAAADRRASELAAERSRLRIR
jgi:serine/threonine protein kinase